MKLIKKLVKHKFSISLFGFSLFLFISISYRLHIENISYISQEDRLILWGISLLAGIGAVISYRYLNSRIKGPIYLEAGARSRLEATEKYEFIKNNIISAGLFLFFTIASVHLYLFSLTPALSFLVPLELWSFFIVILKMKLDESSRKTKNFKLPSMTFFWILGMYLVAPYSIFRIEIVDSGLEGFVTAISDSLVLAVSGGLLIPYFLIPKLYKKQPFYEKQSKQPMKKVDSKVLFPVLTKVEKVAQKLGSVKFEGWQATPNSELHIRAQVLDKKNFTGCFHCQELTITRKIEVVKPSYSSAGKRLVVYQCHCCDYHQETEEMIPRLSRSSSSSVSTNYDGYSGGSSSGSSSSGDSGGGGSFGGGDSGSGGAGGGF